MTTDAPAVAAARPWRKWGRYTVVAVLILLVIVLSITMPAFRRPANLFNILQQNAIIGIVAIGMLLMIIVGGFDLSVGAVGAATGVVAAWLLIHTSLPVALLGALVVGLIVGVANGVLISRVDIDPFITTLATSVIVVGLLFVLTDAKPVYGVPDVLHVIGLGRIGPMPIAALVFAAVAFVAWVILRFTRFGRYIYAVGGNSEACRLAGVPIARVTTRTYVLGSMAAAVAGLVLLGQTNIGQPSAATSWPLTAIAACVIGGAQLGGGGGTVGGVIIGTLLLGVMSNALNLMGVSPFWKPALTGLIILIAVGVESRQKERNV
jgi:ribose transport system permease protein/putative xylitol transport system permease protein